MPGLLSTVLRLPTLVTFFVILALSLVLIVEGPAGAQEEPGGEGEQEPEAGVEDGDAGAGLAESVIQPIAGGWSLLANTGPAASPATLLAPISDLVTAAFTFDAERKRFRSFRAGQPARSDLSVIEEGEAFWVFVPPERLGGDLSFLEAPAGVRGLAAELQPGFTLAGWTGSDGVRISAALDGLPMPRAFFWETATQTFVIWDPQLPATLREDFALEYGAGLWIDLGGAESVVWLQR